MSAQITPVDLHAQWLGRIEYSEALSRMGAWQTSRRNGAMPDTFYYLEHPSVITVGRAANEHDCRRLPHEMPVIEVPRGGKATYHGPGQLIGYGIVDLSPRPDLDVYIRAIEEALVSYLQLDHQLPAVMRPGYTGVWIDAHIPRKIASIGISARRWVSGHGFALNVLTDLSAFERIVPCGMPDVCMTSIVNEIMLRGDTVIPLDLQDVAAAVHIHLTQSLRSRGYGCFV